MTILLVKAKKIEIGKVQVGTNKKKSTININYYHLNTKLSEYCNWVSHQTELKVNTNLDNLLPQKLLLALVHSFQEQ